MNIRLKTTSQGAHRFKTKRAVIIPVTKYWGKVVLHLISKDNQLGTSNSEPNRIPKKGGILKTKKAQ